MGSPHRAHPPERGPEIALAPEGADDSNFSRKGSRRRGAKHRLEPRQCPNLRTTHIDSHAVCHRSLLRVANHIGPEFGVFSPQGNNPAQNPFPTPSAEERALLAQAHGGADIGFAHVGEILQGIYDQLSENTRDWARWRAEYGIRQTERTFGELRRAAVLDSNERINAGGCESPTRSLRDSVPIVRINPFRYRVNRKNLFPLEESSASIFVLPIATILVISDH